MAADDPFLNIPEGFVNIWQAKGYNVIADLTHGFWSYVNDPHYWVMPRTSGEFGGGSGRSSPTQGSVVTGIDPNEIGNALYGKIIPLSALGLARIGTAGLIFGPYFNGGLVSFAVSFGFPANPAGERRVYEISLDSQVAWENAAGSPAGALGAGFLGAAFDCRFYSGTQTQGADPLEAAMFGAEAVAYRPQMMLWFTNLPVAEFDNKVPFVSCKIGEVTDGAVPGDGINLGDALERFAYSPWLEYDSSDFEATGVADIVQAMILTEDQSFLDLLRVTARVYRTLDILQTDKLRVNDRGSIVTPDVSLYRDNVVADGGVQYSRQEENSVPRELELTTIDPDADYVFMPSKAARPLHPVPVTASVSKDTISLPVVIDANTRTSLVTYAKYQEDNARKRLSLRTMLYGYRLEPGDLFRLVDVADGFDNSEVWKVVESSHGANYINEISAEAILKCAFYGTELGNVLLLLGFEGADGSTGAPGMSDESGLDHDLGSISPPAQIDTAQSVFGGSSLLLDGTSSYINYNNSPDFYLTNQPFTIECWIRPLTTSPGTRVRYIISLWGPIGVYSWRLYQLGSAIAFNISTTGSDDIVLMSGGGMSPGTWYAVCAEFDGAKYRLYVNGAMVGSSTMLQTIFSSPGSFALTIGANWFFPTNFVFNGWIDEVRITRGQARYASDSGYTVATSAFPRP